MTADYSYSIGCLAKCGFRESVRRRRIKARAILRQSQMILIDACCEWKGRIRDKLTNDYQLNHTTRQRNRV